MPTEHEQAANDRLPVVYALIWRSTKTDDEFDQNEFESRIPRLMVWLRSLHAQGKLVACGGGGFENHAGGLTLVYADSPEEAREMSTQSPMNEIGRTELFEWSVYYGNLVRTEHADRLKPQE